MSAVTKQIDLRPEREDAGQLVRHGSPMDMLNHAVNTGAGIEIIEKLMTLQERWENMQGRKEFDEAVAAAKAEIRPIVRNSEGHNSKRYADIAAIATVVDPVLSKYGLSYRYRATQTDKIGVTCILSHKRGHYEETTLCGPADKTGNKNDIQAIGSTLTYLQRYSLVLALGLATANDDDGKAAGDSGDTITDEQVQEISNLLIETKSNIDRFLKAVKLDSLTQIRADKFDAAKEFIRETAKKRAAREAGDKGAQS